MTSKEEMNGIPMAPSVERRKHLGCYFVYYPEIVYGNGHRQRVGDRCDTKAEAMKYARREVAARCTWGDIYAW
jgi:hypothetical protein